MTNDEMPQDKYSFAEQIRQGRIDTLMKAEEELNVKKGSYDPSPEAHDKRRRYLASFPSTELHEMIKNVEHELRDIELVERAKYTEDLHKKGILKAPERDSSNSR